MNANLFTNLLIRFYKHREFWIWFQFLQSFSVYLAPSQKSSFFCCSCAFPLPMYMYVIMMIEFFVVVHCSSVFVCVVSVTVCIRNAYAMRALLYAYHHHILIFIESRAQFQYEMQSIHNINRHECYAYVSWFHVITALVSNVFPIVFLFCFSSISFHVFITYLYL